MRRKAEGFPHIRRQSRIQAMADSLERLIESYDPGVPLAEPSTIPSPWYTDQRVFRLEQETVFSRSWQVDVRTDQLTHSSDYVRTEIAAEPLLIVCGNDNDLRGFFTICR